jgi:hypothetical protein
MSVVKSLAIVLLLRYILFALLLCIHGSVPTMTYRTAVLQSHLSPTLVASDRLHLRVAPDIVIVGMPVDGVMVPKSFLSMRFP